MKSLEERQKQRKEQRELLSHGGVVPLVEGSKEKQDQTQRAKGPNFDAMNIEQMKGWAKSKGAPVPEDKKTVEEVRQYVTNFAIYLEANPDAKVDPSTGKWTTQ